MSLRTTGVPKDICCPHRGIVHCYDWRIAHYPYKEDDRVACHVFFVWELLRPMIRNRPLYVIPDSTIYDTVKIVGYLATHNIMHKLSKLRVDWLCGELVTLVLWDRFIRLSPTASECDDASDVNLAAMSEFDNSLSTKYTSCGEVMPNMKSYVLDDDFKLVSVRVTGELASSNMSFQERPNTKQVIVRASCRYIGVD
ncbi:L-aminoadipate-semialdehyde dehydrogenase large subunit [Phytophthora megakarya]|uniref:L-aminoadipate-semialdehyde dehydrogenase large subunit n=1 Tax=Phytophthora megakarya TaxID=4795 RepID=A0A225VKD4_9STRA|nr:L-aminoadipate-semialdehyde dehydrogenase large subunit [Phytophthora megakarya]